MENLAIGIDIGGTNIKGGVISSKGEVIISDKISTQAKKGFSHTFLLVRELISKLLAESADRGKICGIGCATAGQVDHLQGKVVFATDNLPGLSGFQLKNELHTAFQLPVAVENDVNAVALGEHWIGSAAGLDDFICLTLGTGVGGAIFRNGSIDYGANDISGEFGHFSINFDGPLCNCGNRGCFEQYGSVTALIQSMRQRLSEGEVSLVRDLVEGDPQKINGEIIFEAKEMGDALASAIVDDYLLHLSVGIVGLLHILNPGGVIIGGGITQLGDKLICPLTKNIIERAMPKFTENLLIKNAGLGDNAGIIGVVRKLFI
ncbi:MAG: transcriptional regulator/sugar kinase [Eubacterium sp.]|nr:transcriptional regulator/sugar kinase [Eubacterium sp.]